MTATPEVLHLSAFADAPHGGNPAGVVLDAAAMTDAEMLAVAAELGYAETAFVTEPAIEGDLRHVRIRFFSPGAEVPFCGHATIATAVALAERRGAGEFLMQTQAGAVPIVTASDGSRVIASFTSVEPDARPLADDVADRLLGLLGLGRSDLVDGYPILEVFAGNWHPVVVLATGPTFDRFLFEPAAVRALMDEQGWAGTVTVVHVPVSTESGEAGLVIEARNLFPVGSLTEDPATGSAAASLGAYLRTIGAISPPARFSVLQGRHIGRPSRLLVDVPDAGGVTVSGTATTIASAG